MKELIQILHLQYLFNPTKFLRKKGKKGGGVEIEKSLTTVKNIFIIFVNANVISMESPDLLALIM